MRCSEDWVETLRPWKAHEINPVWMPWCFLHSSDGRAAEILTAGLQQRAFVLPFA